MFRHKRFDVVVMMITTTRMKALKIKMTLKTDTIYCVKLTPYLTSHNFKYNTIQFVYGVLSKKYGNFYFQPRTVLE